MRQTVRLGIRRCIAVVNHARPSSHRRCCQLLGVATGVTPKHGSATVRNCYSSPRCVDDATVELVVVVVVIA